jgi:Ca2+-binding RTX toxin-like protein
MSSRVIFVAAKPVVEALEERRMLSGSVALRSGVLRVEGTRRADDVVITRTANGRYDVSIGGEHTSVRARNVRRIAVETGRGADDVSVSNENGGIGVLRTINAGGDDDTVTGGKGADEIIGDDGDDNLDGRQGDDTISGGIGDDHCHGGDGNDDLNGDDGNDSIDGEAGDDSVNGDLGDDDVDGGEGEHDHVRGGGGHDAFHGGDDDANEREDDDGGDDVGDDNGGLLGGHGADDMLVARGNVLSGTFAR